MEKTSGKKKLLNVLKVLTRKVTMVHGKSLTNQLHVIDMVLKPKEALNTH